MSRSLGLIREWVISYMRGMYVPHRLTNLLQLIKLIFVQLLDYFNFLLSLILLYLLEQFSVLIANQHSNRPWNYIRVNIMVRNFSLLTLFHGLILMKIDFFNFIGDFLVDIDHPVGRHP
jgi:hypothetical protein